MNRNPSEYIGGFLTFLRETEMEYHIARDQEEEANRETQDILHWLELPGRLVTNTHDLLKVAVELGAVRQRRRQAKDAKLMMEDVVNWIDKNEPIRKSLERLLGELRKAEKRTQNRHYMGRTNIMSEILGPPEGKQAFSSSEKQTARMNRISHWNGKTIMSSNAAVFITVICRQR